MIFEDVETRIFAEIAQIAQSVQLLRQQIAEKQVAETPQGKLVSVLKLGESPNKKPQCKRNKEEAGGTLL